MLIYLHFQSGCILNNEYPSAITQNVQQMNLNTAVPLPCAVREELADAVRARLHFRARLHLVREERARSSLCLRTQCATFLHKSG
jgi:hypothetical protein